MKVTEPLVPPGVVTEMLPVPNAALPAIVKSARTDVGLTTWHALGVMPVLDAEMLQGAAKLVPVNVTGTVEP